jgi:hypothetical protein
MAAKEILVKKYVVRLSGEERERLETLIRKGKSPARRVLKARILLKDVSEGGKGWSDNRIIEALETSPSMVYRTRKQLVQDGFEAVLSRKPRAIPAIARIFDGEKEAKLIALACSKPPKGRARWTLRLLENKQPQPEALRNRQAWPYKSRYRRRPAYAGAVLMLILTSCLPTQLHRVRGWISSSGLLRPFSLSRGEPLLSPQNSLGGSVNDRPKEEPQAQ